MSNINNRKSSTSSTAAEASATETPMFTPDEILEQVRVMRERIPDFVQLPNDRATRTMRRQSRLNPEFAQEAFGAVGASETVQSAIGNTPEELLRAEDESRRWGIVEAELSGLLRGVTAGNVVRRQRIAEVALQAYNVSTQLVKRETLSGLLPHVERMKRLPKYGTRRRGKPAEEQVQPPQPSKPA